MPTAPTSASIARPTFRRSTRVSTRSSSSSPAISVTRYFETAYLKLGVYICYDRHFPEGWRALALNGAEYIVNPSATVAGTE